MHRVSFRCIRAWKGGAVRLLPVPARLGFQQGGTEAKVLHKWIKIPVAVEQDETAFDAVRGNDGVDGFAYGDSLPSQDAEVPRRLNGNVLTAKRNRQQRCQQPLGFVEVALTSKSLKHFSENEVAHGNRFAAQQAVKFLRLRRLRAPKVVNPA